MKISHRRVPLAVLLASTALFTLATFADKSSSNARFLAFVGSYTSKTESKGIYAFEFDARTGQLTPKGVAAETRDPSWVVIHPSGKFAYAANEAGKQSSITAFSVDPQSAKLTQLNQLPAFG